MCLVAVIGVLLIIVEQYLVPTIANSLIPVRPPLSQVSDFNRHGDSLTTCISLWVCHQSVKVLNAVRGLWGQDMSWNQAQWTSPCWFSAQE